MHHAGFAPVLNAMGLQIDYGTRPDFYDTQYFIKASFPPTKTLVTLGNGMLEKCGAKLRFVSQPSGFVQTATFLDMLSEDRYPISECYPTPDKERDDNEYGSHDMLLHSPAFMALAVTNGYDHLKSRAIALRDGSAFKEEDTDKNKERKRGTFIRNMDSGINVLTFAGLLDDDMVMQRKFRSIGDTVPYGEARICEQQVIDTMRNPLSNGFLAMAGEVA
jgi:hypothetical protein